MAKQKATVQSKKVDNTESISFSKVQLVKSQRYAARRDALNALLEDDKTYSFAEVDGILKKFDKGGK